MQIQPIATQNNNTPQFKRLGILSPDKWNQNVLRAVLGNPEFKAYANQVERYRGRDFSLQYKDYGDWFTILASSSGFVTYTELFAASTIQSLTRMVEQFRCEHLPSKGRINDKMYFF